VWSEAGGEGIGSLSSGQVVTYVLLDIALILIAARIVGGLFVRISQPRVVGEIIAGVLLGPTLLASLSTEIFPAQSLEVLTAIGQLGLLLFSFLIGLELEIVALKHNLRTVVLVGLGVVGVPMAVAVLITPILANDTFQIAGTNTTGFALFVGAILAVSALPVMVRILQEKGLTISRLGSVGIAAAAVCTVAMFVIGSVAASVSIGETAGAILTKLGLIALYLVGTLTVGRALLRWVAVEFRRTAQMSPGLYAIIFIVILASGLAAHMLGLTVIVGGFIAGVALPIRKPLFSIYDARLGELTAVILLPIFLAVSGLATDFRQLTGEAVAGLAALVVAGIASKWIGGAVFARAGGLTWAEGNVIGVLMSCRGLLVLVVALVGVKAGIITPVMQLGAVLMALITTAMTGPLFDATLRKVPVRVEG
jgi:Kef-type K+ transport system membrane component KefB